ncbi:MAG: respiratory nitrate reductase subunit gamma [Thermoprotei archaeon]
MIFLIQILSYFTIIIFIIGVIIKWRKWSSMPIHLRWELYPVPHEAGKSYYGGSYLEEIDWWQNKRKTTFIGELKEMLAEMLFIKRVYKYKRELWWLTYSFHGGIYLILVWFILLLFSGFTINYEGIAIPSENLWSQFLYYTTLVIGSIGIIATTFGTISLIIKRFSNNSMRKYTTGAEYFNLFFILITLITGIMTWYYDPDFSIARAYMTSLISFGRYQLPQLRDITIVHIVILQLLWIYIPFSKMSHFIGKFFTYHKVLWDDEPNLKGSIIETKIRELVKLKLPWNAFHIKKGKTWFENASGDTK